MLLWLRCSRGRGRSGCLVEGEDGPACALGASSCTQAAYRAQLARRAADEELAKNVTDAALVVVAQRIATIMHADQIIVLDDGHVVGTGTHEELLRSCPAYLEIAQSQLSAEELGLTQEEIAAVMEGGER